MKEAVLRQMLQHALTKHAQCSVDNLITLAEEELETLQALLEAAGTEGDQRPPIARTLTSVPLNSGGAVQDAPPGEDDHAHPTAEQRRGDHREEDGREKPAPDQGTVQTTEEDADTGTYGGDTRHVIQFIRRHDHGDALRMASSVLFATIGVVETQTGRSNETMLIRAIAGEVHAVAR